MVVVSRVDKAFVVRTGPGGAPATRPALLDVGFQVGDGEFVSIVGPSGCGKTTLVRIIGGLIPRDRGEVSIGGRVVRTPSKDVGIVFQNFGLYPWRTVMGNVEFPLELDGLPRAERREIAARYLDLVGLRGFERHYPHELSGGMQQRVGIARAFTRKPTVLLMDEPFGSLDAQTREDLQAEFLRIWERTATTVIFITHSIDEAVYLSSRVIVLSRPPGRVQEIIPVDLPGTRWDRDVRSETGFIDACAHIRGLLRTPGAEPVVR